MAEEFLDGHWVDTTVVVECDCEDGPCGWVHYERCD